MVTVKERLIKVGISTDQADALIKNFYIKEKDPNDNFTQYWIKRIDEKVEKLDDKINNLPAKLKEELKEELKSYATQTDIANLRTDIAKNTNKILIVMISIVALAVAIIKL